MIARLDDRHEPWDIVVIGGSATGACIAVDAAGRGYDVLLLEQHDFDKGTGMPFAPPACAGGGR